eukprot:926887-Lingulodinium_polyedra.AAC.1
MIWVWAVWLIWRGRCRACVCESARNLQQRAIRYGGIVDGWRWQRRRKEAGIEMRSEARRHDSSLER